MIDWIEGKPITSIDCCVVIYKYDYEFARFDGENWKLCFRDEGGVRWVKPVEPIEYYARLNMPDS